MRLRSSRASGIGTSRQVLVQAATGGLVACCVGLDMLARMLAFATG
jgi:hypothetical protein